jgi:acyl dehydratase
MPISGPAPIGHEVDTVQFPVERGKIGEFARATFARDPVHTSLAAARTAGFAAEAATPTHVVVAGHQRDQRALLDTLGLDLARVVVGSVSWHYERPLVAGDELRGTRRIVSDERREGRRGGSMRLVTLETEYLDASGTTVARVRELIVECGTAA